MIINELKVDNYSVLHIKVETPSLKFHIIPDEILNSGDEDLLSNHLENLQYSIVIMSNELTNQIDSIKSIIAKFVASL